MQYPIVFTDLASGDAHVLQKRYRMRTDLANAVATANITRRTDLLDNQAVCRNASAAELYELLRAPRTLPDEFPPEPSITNIQSQELDGIVLSTWTLADKRRRAVIQDAAGELISADVADDELGIRTSTIRLLGYSLAELTDVPNADKHAGARRLDAARAGAVGSLWEYRDLPAPDDGVDPRAFRALSAILSVLLWRTRPRQALPEADGSQDAKAAFETRKSKLDGKEPDSGEDYGCGPGSGWLADAIPELWFHDCCVGHDKCYEKGGDSFDKERCDYRFYSCMPGTKWYAAPLATLYFLAVNTFGQGSFHYHGWAHSDIVGRSIAGAASVAAGVAAGVATGNVLVGIGAFVATAVVLNLMNLVLAGLCKVTSHMECVAWAEKKYKKSREKRVQEIHKHKERRKKRKRECSSWGWFSWICSAWSWVEYWVSVVVTEVVWVTKTVWYWVTETVCLQSKRVFELVGCGIGKLV